MVAVHLLGSAQVAGKLWLFTRWPRANRRLVSGLSHHSRYLGDMALSTSPSRSSLQLLPLLPGVYAYTVHLPRIAGEASLYFSNVALLNREAWLAISLVLEFSLITIVTRVRGISIQHIMVNILYLSVVTQL